MDAYIRFGQSFGWTGHVHSGLQGVYTYGVPERNTQESVFLEARLRSRSIGSLFKGRLR